MSLQRSGGNGFPAAGQHVLDLVVFHGGQATQHIGQVFLRIDAAAAATLNDGVDDGAAPAGVGMADEQ